MFFNPQQGLTVLCHSVKGHALMLKFYPILGGYFLFSVLVNNMSVCSWKKDKKTKKQWCIEYIPCRFGLSAED